MKRDIDIEKVYDNYEKGWNGRMDLKDLPEMQKKATYPHPNKKGEFTSQHYIEYSDIAVVVFVRKKTSGQFEFGLIEQEAPAFIYDAENPTCSNEYTGIFLETPSFALPEKDTLPEIMEDWIEEKVGTLGFEMQGFAELDGSKTAVSQSFTNQYARFYIAGIDSLSQDNNDKIHWFPLSSLESFLDIQRKGGKMGLHSSVQTLYSLEQLRNKYLSQIRNIKKTIFELDRPLPILNLIKKVKTNPSYRFNIWEVSYTNSNEPENVKMATYIESRSNAASCLLMTKDQKNILLLPQQRSPFLETGEETKLEVAGGLLEGKSYVATAIAELSEEEGFDAKNVKEFTGPLAVTPLNSELCQAFITYYEDGREGAKHLDEQESIGERQPISFKKIKENLNSDNIVLSAKYYILLKSRELEKGKSHEEEK